MQTLQPALRLLCVNCNIRIEKLRRHLVFELDTRVISKICEWNPSIVITEEHYICDVCKESAIQHVNSGLANEPGESSSRGHMHACLVCGSSLRNRKCDLIVRENPSQLQQAIYIELENRIAPRQATSLDHVCHPCWLRLKRVATRNMQQNIQLQAEPEPEPEPELETELELEPEPEPEPQPQDQQAVEVPGMITLLQYRRAPNTASHCVFYNCQNRDLHRFLTH
ncbi:unnamed protein product [Arctia plantaginis]|uniref:Uncharacterized protein n=1 Tax=Arctia plantaginis TaxID=874455 RepID=A0A8S0ZJQ3_ARCPL|nr:unnamed protein product [Arctia plantaginis]